MSQFSTTPEYLPPQPQRTNVPAVVSLVTGILSCIPFLSAVAVITGILGLTKTKDPAVGGRGMATAGLILGSIGVLWTVVALLGGAGLLAVYRGGAPMRATVRQFAADIGNQDANAAMQECSSSMDRALIDKTVTDAGGWGKLSDSTVVSFNFNSNNGSKSAVVVAKLQYASASKTLQVSMIKEGALYKIDSFTWRN